MNTSNPHASGFEKTYHFLGKIEDTFLMVCFSIIAIALLMQIFCRYCLNSPLVWTEELSRYLLVWITFFGINYGLRRNKHIQMEFFYNKMSEQCQRIVTVLTQGLIIYFMILLFRPTLDFVRMQMGIESSAMQISMGIVYISLPIGFFLSTISMIFSTLETLRSFAQAIKRG